MSWGFSIPTPERRLTFPHRGGEGLDGSRKHHSRRESTIDVGNRRKREYEDAMKRALDPGGRRKVTFLSDPEYCNEHPLAIAR